MARARFRKGRQGIFFKKVLRRSGYTLAQLAKRCGVVSRTLNHWRREEYLADYDVVASLSKEFGIPLVRVQKLGHYWYVGKGASQGGKNRYEKYGFIGTINDKIKGGMVSQQRRREDPEKYRRLGCIVKKDFIVPHYSEALAELVGIILGDGAINDYQVRITLDRNRDKEYAEFVAKLMESVLGERPSQMVRKEDNTIALTISGAGLVETLEKIGMQRGNRVVHQVGFPRWIRGKLAYRIACTRGLFDTDGGFYFHQKTKKKYLGWCFANFSKPILSEVADTLRELDFNVKKVGEHKLYMYRAESMSRYLKVIGSNNPKNAAKLKFWRGA